MPSNGPGLNGSGQRMHCGGRLRLLTRLALLGQANAHKSARMPLKRVRSSLEAKVPVCLLRNISLLWGRSTPQSSFMALGTETYPILFYSLHYQLAGQLVSHTTDRPFFLSYRQSSTCIGSIGTKWVWVCISNWLRFSFNIFDIYASVPSYRLRSSSWILAQDAECGSLVRMLISMRMPRLLSLNPLSILVWTGLK